MPRRRQQSFLVRVMSEAGALSLSVWDPLARRPVDSVAIICAVATALVIVVNAMFLQSSMQAPRFPDARSARPTPPLPLPQPAPARRNDAIADLIGPSPRIAAVQRVLAEYGYGQIKATGTLDDATSAAIAKFERDHNMPSSGRISDRLMRELTAMVGHQID